MADRYGLRITRKPGSGISISGSEEAYRRAIRAFINENIDTHMLREATSLQRVTQRVMHRCSTEISVRS